MRRAAKVDNNAAEVIAALEHARVQVRDTSRIGEGFPDALCLYRGRLFLLEIKNPDEASREQVADPDHIGMLTPSQLKMRRAWPIIVALTAEEAIRKMDALVEGV